ncbi:putative signal transducing protein [Thalassotalea mangrovi]|uniref:DUF2007 domain-containing protein n=1 Tax=Thalassotalea mangrovi TaxID=2572245 RepID=A0A4U1B1F0_9GAMM|nr:DUF2007 domain-containing protein [Thalassotalea mangrovi]TKB42973.1 DUF2007 domain-containing protein [Thalassotalea mangrovi]
MKKIYSHPHLFFVENMQNILALEGIETQIKNQYLTGASGDVPFLETWPELWVKDERQAVMADDIIRKSQDDTGSDWYCKGCKEVNAGSFELCWNCQQAKA